MDAPPENEDSRAFVRVALQWAKRSLPVPDVHAIDLLQGYLLLEDFGAVDLTGISDAGDRDSAYRRALDDLVALQSVRPVSLPNYDRRVFDLELSLFPEWHVRGFLGVEWSRAEQMQWQATCETLFRAWCAMPSVIVHRDFHARNLMALDQHRVGWLDFQDAIVGPVAYDVVSLLKDCYVDLSTAEYNHYVAYYHHAATAAGVLQATLPEFHEQLRWVGIQRHLKVLGIFVRLNMRDNKPKYLQDLPRVRRYVLDATAGIERLSWLHQFLIDNRRN